MCRLRLTSFTLVFPSCALVSVSVSYTDFIGMRVMMALAVGAGWDRSDLVVFLTQLRGGHGM